MSVNPQMMAALLAGQLGQGQQPLPASGALPQASPLGGAAEMAQKVMLMNALRQGQKPPGTPQPGGAPYG